MEILLEQQPSNSPELNAAEQVWKTLKCDLLASVVYKHITALKIRLKNAFACLANKTKKIVQFVKHPLVQDYKSKNDLTIMKNQW